MPTPGKFDTAVNLGALHANTSTTYSVTNKITQKNPPAIHNLNKGISFSYHIACYIIAIYLINECHSRMLLSELDASFCDLICDLIDIMPSIAARAAAIVVT